MPNGWTPDQIKQFQDYWDTEFVGDLARRRRAKFVPGGTAVKVQQTKEPEHKDDFDESLARIICFAFRHDPEKWIPVFRTDHASSRPWSAINKKQPPTRIAELLAKTGASSAPRVIELRVEEAIIRKIPVLESVGIE